MRLSKEYDSTLKISINSSDNKERITEGFLVYN